MTSASSRQLGEALLAAASGIHHLEAGTGLLIDCGSWLDREDFTGRFITTGASISDGVTLLASTDWEAAGTALNACLVIKAIAHAAGLSSECRQPDGSSQGRER